MKLVILLTTLAMFTSCASKKPKVDVSSAGAAGTSTMIVGGSSDDSSAGGLQTVHFDFHSANLNASARRVLDENKAFLDQHPGMQIRIEGHCDSRGSVQLNLALGNQRAKFVREYLKAKGVSAKRMSIVSYGKERPLSHEMSEEAWAKNRRANFVIVQIAE